MSDKVPHCGSIDLCDCPEQGRSRYLQWFICSRLTISLDYPSGCARWIHRATSTAYPGHGYRPRFVCILVFWNVHSVLGNNLHHYLLTIMFRNFPVIAGKFLIAGLTSVAKNHRAAPAFALAGLLILHQSSLGATYGIIKSRLTSSACPLCSSCCCSCRAGHQR
jgi:hypothetical protein